MHCNDFAANSPENSVALVRSPDTDMFLLLSHINQTVLFDIGKGDKRRLLNVHAFAKDLGDEINLFLVYVALHYLLVLIQPAALCAREKLSPSHS